MYFKPTRFLNGGYSGILLSGVDNLNDNQAGADAGCDVFEIDCWKKVPIARIIDDMHNLKGARG